MKRRELLTCAALAPLAAARAAAPRYHLRYAPHVGMARPHPVERQLEIFAEAGRARKADHWDA